MDPDELDRYLDYYRGHVRRDPTNVEARLRLATIFREIDDRRRATEHFEVAAELLADRELYLEAIAACKAVLQLDPDHRSVKYLLAHLYARTPEAFEDSPRVARPLERTDTSEAPRRSYRTDRETLEDETDVSKAPDASARADDEATDDDLRETLDMSREERRELFDEASESEEGEPLSRDEMEELLTTIDVEPSDIIDIEEISDVEAFEEKYGSD